MSIPTFAPPQRRHETVSPERLLIGIGIGFVAGLAGYALYAASRDRDGLRHRPADSAPGRTARQKRFGRYAVTGRTVTIDRPRDEVYAYWRDVTRLPDFMENVRKVETRGELQHWTIRGPAGRDISVTSRVVSDRPGEEIAWRSTPESDIDTEGNVRFRDAPGGRGTEVEAFIAYHPPGGELGRMVAKLFQAEPAIQGRRELRRLKMLLETGEIATSMNRKSPA